jgi:peptidoglycan/xylan/chitin deacetylase (PgdA/CDA1 family)
MTLRSLFAAASLLASASVIACSAETTEDAAAESGDAVSTKNLSRQHFGLEDHELVLTLDDGPGPRTKDLVDYLVAHQVPAVFFEVGKNAKEDPSASAYVAAHSHLVPGGLIVANHSMNHSATPLPKMGVDGATNEILEADAILSANIAASQAQFSDAKYFFRPPYGAFTALGAAKIDEINARGADKYTGPIFWDIGGELTDTHSADWACWTKRGIDVARCQAGYVAEAELRKKGLILCHDVHAKTVDMLIGGDGRVGLIEELQSKGFKFVGLRSHEAQAQAQEAPPPPANVEIRAETHVEADGTVTVTAEGVDVTSIVVYFDQDATGKRFSNPASGTVAGRRFAPGQHTLHVAALDATGKVVTEQTSSFLVAQPVETTNGSAGSSACVDYGSLAQVKERGEHFDLFQRAADCSSPAAYVAAPGECYRYKGKLTVGDLPRAIGPDQWTVDYDLSYDTDPSGRSKITLVLEVGTGEILSGRRHAFANPNRAEADVTHTSVDCAEGVWHGKLAYTTGVTEAFRLSRSGR